MIKQGALGNAWGPGNSLRAFTWSAAAGPKCTLDWLSSRFASRMPLVIAPSA